jgi:hypothetical protein
MPEASGENVVPTEVNTAGRPEVSDIMTSNPMDFVPNDQPHMKHDDEEEGETTSESRDLGDTAASNPTEKPATTLPWFAARMTIYYTDSAVTPIQILLLTKREIAKIHTNGFCD